LAPARFWHHLYNDEDHVFTASLALTADNFAQALTPFGRFFALNHDAVPGPGVPPDHAYLTHPTTVADVWPAIAGELVRPAAPATRALLRPVAPTAQVVAPKHRAFLVGINNYPDPQSRLEGCVNDVFQVSAVLQECGFAAQDIRVVLDERATK